MLSHDVEEERFFLLVWLLKEERMTLTGAAGQAVKNRINHYLKDEA
jgi:hypothetical protein